MTTQQAEAATQPTTVATESLGAQRPSLRAAATALLAAAGGLVCALILAMAVRLGGMPKPIAYAIVGLVCLWLVSVGADRAIKRRRARP